MYDTDPGGAVVPNVEELMREVLPDNPGNALADVLDPATGDADTILDRTAHPVPHPGCTACDPAFMRSRLAHAGFPRRVRRPVRFVAVEPGGPVLAVFGKGST